MTKVKDLIDVIVDNTFINIPVDSERYELVDLLHPLTMEDLMEMSIPDRVGQQLGENVYRFLLETEKAFLRAQRAARLVDCGIALTTVDWNRYHSAICALTRVLGGSEGFNPFISNGTAMLLDLWYAYTMALKWANVSSASVPKGRRLST